jgi:hypothetical protein
MMKADIFSKPLSLQRLLVPHFFPECLHFELQRLLIPAKSISSILYLQNPK